MMMMLPADSVATAPQVMTDQVCQLCGLQPSRYSCPRCTVRYCSLSCYRSERHTQCTEAFARDGVIGELAGKRVSNEDRARVLDMLQRHREAYADEMAPQSWQDTPGADADDEEEEEDDPEADALHAAVLERLEGVDLDAVSGEELWAMLPDVMRRNFQRVVAAGTIEGLPEWTPWWPAVVTAYAGGVLDIDTVEQSYPRPLLPITEIPSLSKLVRAEPSPDLLLHLVDILYAYAMTSRTYRDFSPQEPLHAAMLVGLSRSLSSTVKFEFGSAQLLLADLISRSTTEHKLALESIVAVLGSDVLAMLSVKEACSVALRHACAVLGASHQHKAAYRKLIFFNSWIVTVPTSVLRSTAGSVRMAIEAEQARSEQHLAQLRAREGVTLR